MSVMVYSRLGDLLRDRNLTVRDLQRQLAARFGLTVDARTLDRLAQADRVRRPDLELAAAAAEALGVSLNEVFTVETTSAAERNELTLEESDGEREDDPLDPERSRRLKSLYSWQSQRALTEAEWAEMRALVDEEGRRLYERGVQDIAATRGQPVEQVRAELAADLEQKRAWRRDLAADPARRDALIQESWQQQRARIGR